MVSRDIYTIYSPYRLRSVNYHYCLVFFALTCLEMFTVPLWDSKGKYHVAIRIEGETVGPCTYSMCRPGGPQALQGASNQIAIQAADSKTSPSPEQ